MPAATARRKLTSSALLALLIFWLGGTGYSAIEKWNLLDSMYMTIITVTTIGFSEVRPLSPPGRVFTIFIAIFGVGNMFYLMGQLAQGMVEGSLKRVMGRSTLEKQIKALKDHYIICGYGRIGRIIAQELAAEKVPLVVIESNPATLELIAADGFLYIAGEATEDENLTRAGINRAGGLVAVVSSDADNVFIVLTARAMREDLFILSRATEENTVKKLERAGADKVVSPYQIGARKMAQAILRPAIADFLESTTTHPDDGLDLAMEEIMVTSQSKLKDISLLESNIRRDLDLIIIAIKKADNDMIFNPAASTKIQVGDTLIAVGRRDNMNLLEKILGADAVGPTSREPA